MITSPFVGRFGVLWGWYQCTNSLDQFLHVLHVINYQCMYCKYFSFLNLYLNYHWAIVCTKPTQNHVQSLCIDTTVCVCVCLLELSEILPSKMLLIGLWNDSIFIDCKSKKYRHSCCCDLWGKWYGQLKFFYDEQHQSLSYFVQIQAKFGSWVDTLSTLPKCSAYSDEASLPGG